MYILQTGAGVCCCPSDCLSAFNPSQLKVDPVSLITLITLHSSEIDVSPCFFIILNHTLLAGKTSNYCTYLTGKQHTVQLTFDSNHFLVFEKQGIHNSHVYKQKFMKIIKFNV